MSKHINKIFSMIQTELKSEKVELEKVELNVVNDIKKEIAFYKQGFSDMEKNNSQQIDAMKKVFKAQDNLEKAIKNARNSSVVKRFSKSYKILDNAEQQAKELGVAFRDIKGFTDLTSLMGKVEKKLDEIKSMAKRGESFLR
jgi:vacuolar-type H+-ATPase subunit I/STV1